MCVVFWLKIKIVKNTQYGQMNYRYPAWTTHILPTVQVFCAKIEIPESSDFMHLGVTNIILVLRFMKVTNFIG